MDRKQEQLILELADRLEQDKMMVLKKRNDVEKEFVPHVPSLKFKVPNLEEIITVVENLGFDKITSEDKRKVWLKTKNNEYWELKYFESVHCIQNAVSFQYHWIIFHSDELTKKKYQLSHVGEQIDLDNTNILKYLKFTFPDEWQTIRNNKIEEIIKTINNVV
jgi:hypothetical protein